MSLFQGKPKNHIERCGKKSASTRKKSGKKKTQAGSKTQGNQKPVMKSKMKAVIPKQHQEKILPKEPKKVKVKIVNSAAPSDMETETETSAETEICNDSIDLSTKESFSEGKKQVSGGVEKQNDDSDLNKQPEKTKDFCSEGEKK